MSLSSAEIRHIITEGTEFRERVGQELADFAVEAAMRTSTVGNYNDLLDDLSQGGMHKPSRDERRMVAASFKKATSDFERATGGASALLGKEPTA
jgi:hypothetical protein